MAGPVTRESHRITSRDLRMTPQLTEKRLYDTLRTCQPTATGSRKLQQLIGKGLNCLFLLAFIKLYI